MVTRLTRAARATSSNVVRRIPKLSKRARAPARMRSVVASTGARFGAPSTAVCKIGARNAGVSIYPRTGGDPLARLVPNPLHDLTHPMGRLEQSMGRLEQSMAGLHSEMVPIRVLPEVL